VDKEKMKQLARNLISNSIKYRGEKAPQITVKIQKERPVVLHFIDNGIGIPKEDQGKVFNKFYRVERQDKVSGTGLGLSIVKYIAEAHGGKVELESSEEGTRFTMTLAKVI
jgi:two-component system phosphate regulon sensor histidine kinase PhoR